MKAEQHKEEILYFIFKNSQNVESLQVDIGNSVTLHASRICKIAKTDFRKLVGLDYQEGDLAARRLITIKSAKGGLLQAKVHSLPALRLCCLLELAKKLCNLGCSRLLFSSPYIGKDYTNGNSPTERSQRKGSDHASYGSSLCSQGVHDYLWRRLHTKHDSLSRAHLFFVTHVFFSFCPVSCLLSRFLC